MRIDSRGFQMFDWTLSLSHHDSYLNIDDIICTNERITCRSRIPIPKVATLVLRSFPSFSQSSSHSRGDDVHNNDIYEGMKLEIPLWLLRSVNSGRRQIFAVELPIIYRIRYREVFAADPWIVDLRKKCPFFYSLGCHLSSLSLEEASAVLETLVNTFQRRVKNIMGIALNLAPGCNPPSLSRLEELEKALFRLGQSERNKMENWFSRLHERLEASPIARGIQSKSVGGTSLPPKRSRNRVMPFNERN